MKRGLILVFIFLNVLISLSFISAFNWDDGSLVSYYKFDETYGDAIDELGTNILLVAGVDYSQVGATDNTGTSFYFGGSPDTARKTTPSNMNNTNLSGTMWVNITDRTNLDTLIGMTGPSSSSMNLLLRDPDLLELNAYSGDLPYPNATIVYTSYMNKTTFVYWEITTSGLKLYLNNSLVIDDSSIGWDGLQGSTTAVTVGSEPSGASRHLRGFVDEVGIWNRTLNASEISELWNNGLGLAYPLENATFENVNVTNNLDVGQNITGLKGFFDYLGSSVSRIIKGWFTSINAVDVNVTNTLVVNDKNVCLQDGTNCQADVDTEIKSGSASVTESGCTPITFNTNFSSGPVHITSSVESAGDEGNVASIGSPAVDGFDLCLEAKSGSSSYTVYWTATNAGNL
jgi:hypothetical protein